MNKLLTVALLAHGATAFAPASRPLAAIGQQQQRLDGTSICMYIVM